jgi:hypothetical protein
MRTILLKIAQFGLSPFCFPLTDKPFFEPLRSDQRFTNLLKRLHLAT